MNKGAITQKGWSSVTTLFIRVQRGKGLGGGFRESGDGRGGGGFIFQGPDQRDASVNILLGR